MRTESSSRYIDLEIGYKMGGQLRGTEKEELVEYLNDFIIKQGGYHYYNLKKSTKDADIVFAYALTLMSALK